MESARRTWDGRQKKKKKRSEKYEDPTLSWGTLRVTRRRGKNKYKFASLVSPPIIFLL